MKGLERRSPEKRAPRFPTGEEFRSIELAIIAGGFATTAERNRTLSVVRSISRYDSSAAKYAFENLSDESREKLESILAKAGFKLDFPA